MNVMLLAAGRSTRLGALGGLLPKPLVPVCGYPAIAFGLSACARAGFARAVVNLFHHGEQIRAALGDGAGTGVSIAYSVESELLGTGGGLAHARALFEPGPVLVMNAKVVADVDLLAFVSSHVSAHGAGGGEATMLLRDDPDPRKWGAIGVDESGRVVSILDARSPAAPRGAVTLRMFTGIYVLEPTMLDRLRPVFSDVIREAFIPALTSGAVIRGETLGGYFAEHSTPARYLAGNLSLLADPGQLPHPPGPLVGADAAAAVEGGARVVPPCRLQAGAVVAAGAVVGPQVVVCAGARVAAGARIRRAVVWPGAVAAGDIQDAVVAPDGVLAIEKT